MNQKKAKSLRKIARSCSIGLPEVDYLGHADRRKHARRHGGYIPMSMREGTRRLLPASTRAVYKELKHSYNARHAG